MSKKKKITLPKNIDEILKTADSASIIGIFETCDLNARGGYSKQTLLAFDACPDDVARWLVSQGADLGTADTWGNTPLHTRARYGRGRIEVLLELGADLNSRNNYGYTPLHSAADSHNAANAKLLIASGADINAKNESGMTPLETGLYSCRNIDIEETVKLAKVFLDAGMKKTDRMQSMVEEIGKTFEFHREGFNPESVDDVSNALQNLYQLFEVNPVPRRQKYDGKSPIVAKSNNWQQQHTEFWELLVPSSGQANTVQGEAIRITGRISNELEGNGGINWDANFTKMADALLDMLNKGKALPEIDLSEAASIIKAVKKKTGDTSKLAQLAVQWVNQNPAPLKLEPQKYKR